MNIFYNSLIIKIKGKMLRECQLIALQKCKENSKGIVRMCCGSGKSLVEIMLCLQEQTSCFIAPRNALIKQHIETIKELVGYIGNDEYSFETDTFKLIVINNESDYREYDNSEKQVCFIINNCSLSKMPITPDIFIVDEAHTHKDSIIKCAKIKNAKRKYFFTATPQDMNDVNFYGETVYRYDYIHALQRDIVCPFKIVPRNSFS
jgi:superfamily II DNA or RNA helicase